MGRTRAVDVTAEQRQMLERLLATAAKAYVRERAAAILKVADGMPAAQVATHGLLRPRQPDTIYAWLDRFDAEGVAGLTVRTGRGRKPVFSPSDPRGGHSRSPRRRAARAPLAGSGASADALDARRAAGSRA